MVFSCVVHTTQEDQVIGEAARKMSQKRQVQCMGKFQSEGMGLLSIAQGILRKSTGVLQRIVAPIGGVRGVALSFVCPHFHSSRLRTTFAGALQGMLKAVQLVVCGVWRPVRFEGSVQGLTHT